MSSDKHKGDFWEHYFPGYKEKAAEFERDVAALLTNPIIIDSLRQFGYNSDFLKNVLAWIIHETNSVTYC